MKAFRAIPLLFLVACATTAPNQVAPPVKPVTQVSISVEGMDADLLDQMRAELAKIPELKSAQLESNKGDRAVFTLRFEGDLADLPKLLSRLPHPGLRFGAATHELRYTAFDNKPPTVAFLHPNDQEVVSARQQFITVEVPDTDVKEVHIAGKQAQRYKGNVYRLKLELNEGTQQVMATARDKAGNETTSTVSVTVDTTPPALNAQLKLVVEGVVEPGSTVLIDGMEVPVERDGRYRAEVAVRPGQKRVEIIAIDQTGNKTTDYKQIGQ